MNTKPIGLLDDSFASIRELSPTKKKRRSLSLRKIDFDIQSINTANTAQNSPTSLKLQSIPKNMKIKRIENIQELRNIHTCLMKAFTTQGKKIILTDDGHLEALTMKESAFDQEMNKAVVEFIYHRILRAMTSQISYFFDDRGYPITLKDLDKLTAKLYLDHHSLATEVKKELDDYYEEKSLFLWGNKIENECEFHELIQNLPIPEQLEGEELSDNQKLCIAIFQRLYPVRKVCEEPLLQAPVMAPITFLCSYKKIVTAEELFKEALRVISLNDGLMPYLQKLRVLNFIRVFLDNHLYLNEKITFAMRKVIDKIKLVEPESKKPEFMDLYCEILCLLGEKENQTWLRSIALDPHYPVESFLAVEPAKNHYYAEILNYLTDNMKYLAGQVITGLTKKDLFQEKAGNEAGIYYNQLVNFGVNHFIKTLGEEVESASRSKTTVKRKLAIYFEFFIDMAYDLAKKHDYLSSFALYNIFGISQFNHLIFVAKAKKTTAHKFQELESLFSMTSNFETLRKQMKDCQEAGIYFVPLLAPLKNIILHKVEMIESGFPDVEGQKINNEKEHLIAEEVWEMGQILKLLQQQFSGQKISMHTDISHHLMIQEPYNEEKLEAIYQKVKKLLGH